jgi:hypothetical protein
MTRGKSTVKPAKASNQIIATLSLNPSDLVRLREAFDKGKLAELGITGLQIISIEDGITGMRITSIEEIESPKSFADAEMSKRSRKKKDDAPPLP